MTSHAIGLFSSKYLFSYLFVCTYNLQCQGRIRFQIRCKIPHLEKKLSDELSKNQVLVNKFKTNNLKVKIIRINPNNPNELTSFDEESADDLSLLMTSLFANDVQSRKLKDLKSNYEYVFDEKNIDTERNSNDLKTESQMKNKEDDTTENLILF